MIALRKRSFNVDHYLDGKPQPQTIAGQFRGWAVRLNDRIERVDVKAVALKAERILMGLTLSGVAIYLAFAVADAWLAGHFNFGGAR